MLIHFLRGLLLVDTYIRPIGSAKINKASDLNGIMGAKLAKSLIAEVTRGGNTQKKPRRVTLYTSKPSYYLNDGDTLHFYRVDVVTGTILAHQYGGSADSAANHPVEQFSAGQSPDPMVDAVLAVRTYWGGGQTFWEIDIISQHVHQLPASSEMPGVKAN